MSGCTSVAPRTAVTPIVTGLLKPGSDQISNPNILISDATAAGVVPYDDFGTNMRVWQIDFTQLNLHVQGGVKVRFGAWGLGRTVPKQGRQNLCVVQRGIQCRAGSRQTGWRRRRDAGVHFRRRIQERVR